MPASDGGDDFVGVGGPGEGFRVGVVLGEEAVDGGLEVDDGAEDAALQPPLCELGEEALDCVEPGAGGGDEVEDEAGRKIGEITSGGFGPSFNGPVAMGYVAAGFDVPGTKLRLSVRDQMLPAEVVTLPFVPHRYFKSKPQE